jgi:hypothetical protein
LRNERAVSCGEQAVLRAFSEANGVQERDGAAGGAVRRHSDRDEVSRRTGDLFQERQRVETLDL